MSSVRNLINRLIDSVKDGKNQKVFPSSTSSETPEDYRNKAIDTFLSIRHPQWWESHREAFIEYQDYLDELNGPIGSSVICYKYITSGDVFVIKMFDNYLNLLRPINERTMLEEFAVMKIRSATPSEIDLSLKREPTPENSMYAAEQYYRQWITDGDDRGFSSLASALLFFISIYTEMYRFKTIMIKMNGVGKNDSTFEIRLSDSVQTVELTVSYPVIERNFKELLKRIK